MPLPLPLVLVLALPLALASVVPSPIPLPARALSRPAPLVVGHRGAPRELPESTLTGFAEALVHADLIELDVRASADGVLVVHHDATVPARCAPHAGERVRALSWASLREVVCGPSLPTQRPLPGAQLASLDEVLALVRDTPARDSAAGDNAARASASPRRVLIELKADDAPAPAELARLLVASLQRARARSLVVVESFDPRYVAAVRARAPELARALLCGDRVTCARAIDDAARLGALMVSPAHDAIDAAFVADAHRRGLGVVAWTANDELPWSRLRALGVDAIVTDDPRGLRASLAGAR